MSGGIDQGLSNQVGYHSQHIDEFIERKRHKVRTQNFELSLTRCPPCENSKLILTVKLPQPPLLCMFFHDPRSPSDSYVLHGFSLTQINLTDLLLHITVER